jgi:quinol-cytochrome oxidoreductase complex cytochrome b subunit
VSERPKEVPTSPKRKKFFNLDVEVAGFLLSLAGLVYGPLDGRLSFSDAIGKAWRRALPANVNWMYAFGGITLFLFGVLVVTGILLTFYYQPTSEMAYESIRYIMTDVPLGWLVRSVHRWAADGIILFVCLHMLHAFYRRAYSNPRQMNWLVGGATLFLLVAFRTSGGILPWDQNSVLRAEWGISVLEHLPIIGHLLGRIVRGGEEVSSSLLSRSYSGHALVLPWFTFYFLLVHFRLLRKHRYRSREGV